MSQDDHARARLGLGAALLVLTPTATSSVIDEVLLDMQIAECDWRLHAQLDQILHHPRVQALEAARRGLSPCR